MEDIKICLGDIVINRESLKKLSASTFSNFKTSYQISKLIKNLDEELRFFDEENQKIIKKYGKEDPESNNYKIPEEDIEKANKEFQSLLEVEVNLNIDKIDIDVEENSIALKEISPQEIITLEKFFNFN